MIRINGKPLIPTKFPDGTLASKVDMEKISPRVFATVEWLFENNEEMTTLYFIVKHLKRHFDFVELLMPYIPNARMDRVKSENEIFYLKYFAQFINSLEFDKVIVRDPHSAVSEALFNNLTIEIPKRYIEFAMVDCKPDLIFYPDEGAMKRYSSMAPMEYVFGVKRRNWATGKIEGLDVIGDADEIKGKNILIVDDICSKGGTFYHSAKKLKEMGAANIYLYVTHCENTILEGELLDSGLIEKVYTTESIFTKESEKIDIIKFY